MKILFLTENFGYGPVSTMCEIVKKFKELYSNLEYIFWGNLHTAEICKKSNLFDNVLITDSYSREQIEQNKKLLMSADKIVAVETTDVIVNLVNLYDLKNIYLVDNIFWLWDFLEEELKSIKKYFVSTAMPIDENINRIASDFNNIVKVGPIRTFREFKFCNTNNNLMISLGGAEPHTSDENIVFRYYNDILKVLDDCDFKFNNIYVCGGKSIVNKLSKEVYKHNFNFITLNHSEYLNLLYSCSHIICSPGMGNFNEISGSNIKTMFLLPINYSQFYQYEYFKSLNLDFYFDNFNFDVEIEKYLEENEGVRRVLEKLNEYNGNNNIIKVKNNIQRFIDDTNFLEKRLSFYKDLDKQAIENIINQIIEED